MIRRLPAALAWPHLRRPLAADALRSAAQKQPPERRRAIKSRVLWIFVAFNTLYIPLA